MINLAGTWQMKSTKDNTWQEAIVPGTVYTDLLRNGNMEDPFWRENEYKIQKIDNELLNIEKHYQQKMQFENLSKILNQNTMINSDNLNLRTINNLKQLKNNIYLKQKELELLADSEALNMVLRAGYDIDLAQEVFDYAQNDSFYNEKTYYPLVYQRVDNIKEELSFTDKNLLALEGKNNLLNSEVLSIQKSIDKETLIINKPKNYKDYSYKTISREEKILNKAYSFYKNGDFLNSIEYFKKAYDKNPNNYIAPLFLSCCYEKLYEQNNNQKINFIIGYDQFFKLESWKEPEILREKINFIVIPRKFQNGQVMGDMAFRYFKNKRFR